MVSLTRYLAVLLLVTPAAILGQDKTPVYLLSSVAEDDAVGRQAVFELKEAIRGSQGFRLVEDSVKWPYVRFSAVTVSTAAGGTAVAYTISYDSTTMPLKGALITNGVQLCGRERVSNCARSMLAAIDEAGTWLRREAPDLWETLK